MRRTGWIVAAVCVGVLIGLGTYTFAYARGYSYLTNDPQACANCHIMRDHFDAWTRSSHAAVAVCNDCHTPPGTIPKYITKARNGFWHSFYFTLGGFPDPLRITPRNLEVTEGACRTCHDALAESIEPLPVHTRAAAAHPPVVPGHTSQTSCVRCHSDVGHIE